MSKIHTRTDGLFSKLLIIEYFAGIAFSLFVSPAAWSIHDARYFYTAVFVGGLIIAFPLAFIKFAAGRAITRHVIAISQMMVAALWIHLSGGRIESHFSVFGLLALLAFYRDWKVLISATIIVACDNYFRGLYWPESIYGVADPSNWKWLEHTSWVLFEDIVLILAANQSVAEVKKNSGRESKLRESESEYRTLFELAGSGNWEVEVPTGTITKVNKKMCELFGYKEEVMVGLSLADLVPDDEREERMRAFHQATSGTARDWSAERRYKRKDGSVFWAMITASFVRDEGGKSVAALATLQDITKMKATEEQLEVAKDRAEVANQAKTEFLANVSHEIRTPLGAMLGFTQIMHEDPAATPEHKENLATVLRNGELLYRIIDDILDISKVEANRIEIRKNRFGLAEIIEDAMSLLSHKAKEKGLNLITRFESPLPEMIDSDPTRLRQILMNIIGNSIKFTEKGTITVGIRCYEQPSGESTLEIKVSDTGSGISPEKRGKLFQPFGQTDTATSRKYGGTGLGLYLSKRLAVALGGDLLLENYVLGEGCTFTVTVATGNLGRKNLVNLENWKKNTRLNTPTSPIRLDGIRVLTIDDSPDNLLLTYRFLNGCGAMVECADGAEKGIRILESNSFDVVIMDIQMPIMDGYQAIQKLRSLNYKKPVIALTAHAMVGERERCIQAGFDGYLVKPIDKTALVQAVHKFYLEADKTALKKSSGSKENLARS